MIWLLVRQKIGDYANWKSVFDGCHDHVREAGGIKGYVLRDSDDANLVSVAIAWDSLERAQEFLSSDYLRGKMAESGVIGQPDIYFLEVLEELDFGKPLSTAKAA